SPGVVRLIMDGLLPARVPDAVIAEIRGRERNGLVELPKLRGLTPGTRVRVISGPLREQIGIWDPGGSGEHRFQSFADDELRLRWPQLHRAASTEHAAVDLAGVRSEANALDAGHHIGGRVAHQREQARMMGTGAKGATRMKAQRLVDAGRQRSKIDLANIRQITRR